MTEIAFDNDLPEISVEAYDKIDRWRDKLDQTPKMCKRAVFERAAADLFLEAECERDFKAWRAISDAIYVLGRDHAGLADDDIQFVMAGAQDQAERNTNTSPKSGNTNGVPAAETNGVALEDCRSIATSI